MPQLVITFVFFYWPASQAVWQSFLLQDAFGLVDQLRLVRELSRPVQPARLLPHHRDHARVLRPRSRCSRSRCALLLATQADKQLAGAGVYRTLLIWPYAVAPAVAGVLWIFMFQPSLGVLARGLRDISASTGIRCSTSNHAMIMVVLAATWKQISYNFLFFLAGLRRSRAA